MTATFIASLQERFGFSDFRPGQAEAIQNLIEGHHALVVMPTGAGKSLIYQLAALHLTGLTLVISPLIALMKDQVDALTRRNIPATFINSALPTNEQKGRLEILKKGGYRLVYVAPERLRSVAFLNALQHLEISLLAVDEAHCISDWGHDFRPDYLHIATTRSSLNDPLTAALTATATPQVQSDIMRLLGIPDAQRIVTGFNRPNLAFEVRYTASLSDKFQALREVFPCQEGGSIVYVGTRRDAEEVSEFLLQVGGVRAEHYHAGMDTGERSRIQEAFLSGDLPVVAATNAFGMGIDRADVRQVVHFTLPASLEAYYQEAGRAGRDGLDARAVLLYAPQDRALQEYFIETSATTAIELHDIYEALPPTDRGETWISVDDLTRLTGLPEVKIKVGLSQLEQAGTIEHRRDDGVRMLLHRGPWDGKSVQATLTRVEAHQLHRREHLTQIIAYAESNSCRRRILLEHFGDSTLPEATRCCDNCRSKQSVPIAMGALGSLTTSERMALVILDTLRRLKTKVGKRKLAEILKGSHTADIQKYHYDKSIYYSRLEIFSRREIEELIEQLIHLGYLKIIGGLYPVLSLSPKGEAAICNKSSIPLLLPRSISPERISLKRAERKAGGTLEFTAQLFAENLSPAEIASRRGLTQYTIYSHLAQLIAAGKVPVEAVVKAEIRQQIEEVINRFGSVEHLAPIKASLPEDIDFGLIRCVAEGWKRNQIPSIIRSKVIATKDEINEFLSRPHPRLLPGPWSTGWALDFHSRYSGADWVRSATGDLAYRLKYQSDVTALIPLVDQSLALLATYPELGQVDAILPVPPSTPRQENPVSAFAKALGERLKIEVLPVLVKTRPTKPQKEMHTRAQKLSNVAGAFSVMGSVRGKQLLVVDDLFDSGATLGEITCLLLREGAAKVSVLTLTRTIHSDA